MATEVERKYDVPEGFRLPDLTGIDGVASVDEPDVMDLDATYYDSRDLVLAMTNSTMRRRTGGHDAGWHLKRPAGPGFEVGDRSEIQEALTDDLPPGLRDMVADVVGDAPLVPVVRVRNHRHERAVRDADGAVVALIAEDEVSSERLIGRRHRQGWRELEVELVSGARTILDEIESALYAAGASASSSASKFARAYGTIDGGRVLAAYLAEHVAAIDVNADGARDGDPEAVHDMRVAIRRIRSTLRTFRSVLPSELDRLRAELRWIGGQLGAVRDGDVLVERFTTIIAESATTDPAIAPVAVAVRERLATAQARDRVTLEDGLDSDRFTALRALLSELPDRVAAGGPSTASLLRTARHSLRRADTRLYEAADIAPAERAAADRDVMLHDVRKTYKQARYAVELVMPIAGRRAKRLAARLVGLQDTLGRRQDAVVAAEVVRDNASQAHLNGEDTFGYGLLYADLRTEAETHLMALPHAWRRASAPRLRRSLRG